MRLSNILNIETRPFDPATHQAQEADVVTDGSGKQRVRLREQNVIRWRVSQGADGGPPTIESNARRADRCHDLARAFSHPWST